jgi:DNA-binding CsgD family transcriptional regulator
MTALTIAPEPAIAQPTPIWRAPARHGLDGVLTRARREVLLMSTLSGTNAAFRRIDAAAVQTARRRGVRIRAVFPDETRTRPGLCTHLAGLSMAGVEVRTTDDVPLDSLVVDGELAVMPSEESAGAVTVVRLAGVITSATELFHRIWPYAVSLGSSELVEDAELTEREREVIALLALGATDELAASQLGVSVRTVRRAVSMLMDRLGARSRFQAGVKAADRGWLVNEVDRVDRAS